MRKITIAANWKQYLNRRESVDLVKKLNRLDRDLLNRFSSKSNYHGMINATSHIIIFPDAEHFGYVAEEVTTQQFPLGLQDAAYANTLSDYESRSYRVTGHLRPNFLNELYGQPKACIVGHSDRRTLHKEDNDKVLEKFKQIHDYSNIYPILCVGETEQEKKEGLTLDVIKKQIPGNMSHEYEKALFSGNDKSDNSSTRRGEYKSAAIAYEPVWSIGTGKVPTNQEIESVLKSIKRQTNGNVQLFYGGSVDENNIEKLLEIDLIDGFLIGGASTKFGRLFGIIEKVDKFLKETN